MAAIDNNLEAFKLLFEIETALREFLILRCEPRSGPRWYKEVIAKSQVAKLEHAAIARRPDGAEARRASDDKKGWVSRRAFHPICFVDFPELGQAFRMRANVFLNEFLVGQSAAAIADHIDRLSPIRNAIAHNRLITHGDLKMIESTHASVRGEVGGVLFDRLATSPPSQLEKDAEAEQLRTELRNSADAARSAKEVTLPVWSRLKQRWWLEPDWQLDADSVLEIFKLLEKYCEVWDLSFLGRRQRLETWFESNWKPVVFDRAMASLERDSGLAGEQSS
jgi:hypothetical protein